MPCRQKIENSLHKPIDDHLNSFKSQNDPSTSADTAGELADALDHLLLTKRAQEEFVTSSDELERAKDELERATEKVRIAAERLRFARERLKTLKR